MYYVTVFLLVIMAYLIGSIPTAVWIGKAFYNIDIREHGSRNAGATNTIRVLGAKAGIPVFIIDGLKGFASAMLAHLSPIPHPSDLWISFQIFLVAAAVVGHILPVFAHFNGGKGVATLLGASLALHPWVALSSFAVFVLVVAVFRYISMGSIIAGFFYPVFMNFIFCEKFITLRIYSIVLFIVLLVTHVKNIKRLMNGEESKFSFKKKS